MKQPRQYPQLSKAEVKRVKFLSTKKGRDERHEFLVEGWKNVHEALMSSWRVSELIVDPARITPENEGIIESALRRKVKVAAARAPEMNAMADAVHAQGILAVVDQALPQVGDVIELPGHVLLLDGISDPGNLGTLIRSADWFGFVGVIVGPGCSSPFNEKTVRSTAGSLFHLHVVLTDDLVDAIDAVRQSGRRCIAADVNGGSPPSLIPRGPLALLLGNEAHGFRREVRDAADGVVSIPSYGKAESLNVAIAGSVLMAHIAEHSLRS